METIIFFKWLGLTSLSLALLSGGVYWIKTFIVKFFPDWKFWIKYKLLRRKFKKDVTHLLANDLENGVNEDEMFKTILLSGKATPNQARELRYIYKELKGRYKNE